MAALRERILRSCQEAFGHRLMMDAIVPGGLARDIGSHGERAILSALDLLETKFPKLVELYDNTPSLQDRTAETGFVSVELARLFAPSDTSVGPRAAISTHDAIQGTPLMMFSNSMCPFAMMATWMRASGSGSSRCHSPYA